MDSTTDVLQAKAEHAINVATNARSLAARASVNGYTYPINASKNQKALPFPLSTPLTGAILDGPGIFKMSLFITMISVGEQK
jgi:hypothetical protein